MNTGDFMFLQPRNVGGSKPEKPKPIKKASPTKQKKPKTGK